MSRYSERSLQLAIELAEKAAENLRRSGKTVERDPQTGLYVIGRDEAESDRLLERRGA